MRLKVHHGRKPHCNFFSLRSQGRRQKARIQGIYSFRSIAASSRRTVSFLIICEAYLQSMKPTLNYLWGSKKRHATRAPLTVPSHGRSTHPALIWNLASSASQLLDNEHGGPKGRSLEGPHLFLLFLETTSVHIRAFKAHLDNFHRQFQGNLSRKYFHLSHLRHCKTINSSLAPIIRALQDAKCRGLPKSMSLERRIALDKTIPYMKLNKNDEYVYRKKRHI